VERFRVELGLDTVSDSGTALLTGTPATLSANSLNLAVAWASPTSRTSPTNRGDGLPDGDYVHCTGGTTCNHLELMNAVSAKIYMLMRSPQKTAGYTDAKTYRIGSAADAYNYAPNDGYKRHLFMQTVRFTNVSMRRETP
jgi:type IV pilus assembly protein PilW